MLQNNVWVEAQDMMGQELLKLMQIEKRGEKNDWSNYFKLAKTKPTHSSNSQ